MNHTIITALVTLAAIVFILWYFRYDRPKFPPLEMKDDDPLMIEAGTLARASVPRFCALYRQYPKDAFIKLKFISNTGVTEYLWAEVLKEKDGSEYDVRLITPPVSHTGMLDRLYTCRITDIEDWQVQDDKGIQHGAFTQRAMFKIARRDGVPLSKQLQEIEKQYTENP